VKDYPIKLGSMLFTMVEPHRGHEVEYNRWYERDHFYAGCMVGAWTFAGARFVATRDLKALRFPDSSPITPDNRLGSYLALYWILDGHHDEWNRWAVDQVNWLHANGRMFPHRDHIHTLLYRYEWSVLRDPEGPSAELALDRRYPGLGVVVGQAAEGVGREELASWYRQRLGPWMEGSAVGMCLCFKPLPLLVDAPGDVPRSEPAEERFMHLYFLEEHPAALWEGHFVRPAAELEASGLGRVLWASPFVATVPGTDTYADQLH
jgi:hypothetical protein